MDKFRKRGISVNLSLKYVQLYQNKFTDLLSGRPVSLRAISRGEFELPQATSFHVSKVREVLELLKIGERAKTYAATAMNQRSSRAHTVLIAELTQTNSSGLTVKSRLHLVDLAGSEQVKQSKVVGKRFAEAVNINYSLVNLVMMVQEGVVSDGAS